MNSLQFKLFRLYNGVQGALMPRHAAARAKQLFLTPRQLRLKDWELLLEQRGKRQSLRNGTSVIRWGEGVSKALLVHGWESRATQLGKIATFLNGKGYEVYGLDAPAHGKSPGDRAHPLAFVRAIQQADAELGPFDLVLGHSMGAAAVGFALAQGLSCGRAVLISPPADVLGVMRRFSRFIGLTEGATRAFVQAVEQEVGVPAAELDLRSKGDLIRCPVLILHDHEDVEIPVLDSIDLSRHWPKSRLKLTRGYGHRRILRSPQLLEALEEFIPLQEAMTA